MLLRKSKKDLKREEDWAKRIKKSPQDIKLQRDRDLYRRHREDSAHKRKKLRKKKISTYRTTS